MKENQKQEKDLKAFLFTFYFLGSETPRSIMIVAFSKDEASQLLIRWANAKKFKITGIVCKSTKKRKNNARFFTLKMYKKQFITIEAAEKLQKVEA